jgi:hypothetical protein
MLTVQIAVHRDWIWLGHGQSLANCHVLDPSGCQKRVSSHACACMYTHTPSDHITMMMTMEEADVYSSLLLPKILVSSSVPCSGVSDAISLADGGLVRNFSVFVLHVLTYT